MIKHVCVLIVLSVSVSSWATETVNGTTSADTIVVGDKWVNDGNGNWSNQGVHKYVNGTTTAIGLTSGEELDIFGLSGSDTITVVSAGGGNFMISQTVFLKPITSIGSYLTVVHGGTGNDTISGSDLVDYLYGDSGEDNINGRNGGDHIHGGLDYDVLSGSGGDDAIYGNTAGNCYEYSASCDPAGPVQGVCDLCYGGADNDSIGCAYIVNGELGSGDVCWEDYGRSPSNCETITHPLLCQ